MANPWSLFCWPRFFRNFGTAIFTLVIAHWVPFFSWLFHLLTRVSFIKINLPIFFFFFKQYDSLNCLNLVHIMVNEAVQQMTLL